MLVGLAFLVAAPSANAAGATTLDSILVVPNPYNVSGQTYGPSRELKPYERIGFRHLPLPCAMRIYSSSGNLVKTLSFGQGETFPQWDGRNDDNQYIVSDVYIYVVEHQTLGRKIGKFIVIR